MHTIDRVTMVRLIRAHGQQQTQPRNHTFILAASVLLQSEITLKFGTGTTQETLSYFYNKSYAFFASISFFFGRVRRQLLW